MVKSFFTSQRYFLCCFVRVWAVFLAKNGSKVRYCGLEDRKMSGTRISGLWGWIILVVIVVLVGSVTASGKVIYVDDNASLGGNGQNWATPYRYLQDALGAAVSGDEIRVAEGIYKPDEDSAHPSGTGDREATFRLKNGVAIKGGYAGFGQPDPDARDPNTHKTILSGDLLGHDGPDFVNYGENSYHVVTGSGTDETAVLDGFTITSGSGNYNPGSGQLHANQNNIILIPPPEPFYPKNWGGGIYNDSGGRPTLTNCTFTDNCAIMGGGAMYNRGGGSPTLTNCIFTRNRTKYRGGGIRNGPSTKPTLINCAFNENTAGWDGGGMHSDSRSTPNLINCAFIGNIAGDCGGGMSNSVANPTLTDCTFSGNVAGILGGGMYERHNKSTVINCVFTGNFAPNGGGMMNIQNELTLLNCTFSSNSTSKSGGGILNGANTKSTLTNCVFSNNEAGDHGGGIYYSYNNHSTLVNCTLNGNDSADVGGGIYNGQSDLTLTNCRFSGNFAHNGGGIYNSNGIQTIANCTFTGNSAGSIGGGMQNSESNTIITNCILWCNNAPDGAQISGTAAVSYSDVEGTWPGTGNIDADPCFVDANNGDYHLLVDSPCIDTGDNNSIPSDFVDLDNDGDTNEPTPFDLDGNPRIMNYVVDMGTYEFEPPRILYVDGDASGANDGSSWPNAFNDLQSALAEAQSGDEIRVARGIYSPEGSLFTNRQASNPNPPDGSGVSYLDTDLSWTPGAYATSHDVYFGTNSPGIFQGNQIATTFDPGIMAMGTKYYWRIDEVSPSGTTTGIVWSFTTMSAPPPPMGLSDEQEIDIMALDRTATFQLKNGVVIKGGYAGFGEPDPNARDIEAYETILSGDLAANDKPNFVNYEENSYHVVTGSGTDETAVLDGFTITAGNANVSGNPTDDGGGIYNSGGSPELTNCTIIDNLATDDGGGIFNHNGDVLDLYFQ
jgi:predicted outer membrane repeat protein